MIAIKVIYSASSPTNERAYQRIARIFPVVTLHKEDGTGEPQPPRKAAARKTHSGYPESMQRVRHTAHQKENAERRQTALTAYNRRRTVRQTTQQQNPEQPMPEIEGIGGRFKGRVRTAGSRFGRGVRKMFNGLFRGEKYAQKRESA